MFVGTTRGQLAMRRYLFALAWAVVFSCSPLSAQWIPIDPLNEPVLLSEINLSPQQAANLSAYSALQPLGSGEFTPLTNTDPVIKNAYTVSQGTINALENVAGTGTMSLGGTLTFDNSSGLTKSGAGTLTLSGANTYTGLTTISSGRLILGTASALGITTGGATIVNGGTLDLNGWNSGNEQIVVQGAGVGGYGAIVNGAIINTSTQDALRYVTLTGDTTFGGMSTGATTVNSSRWDIRGGSSTTINIGHAFSLTKTGNNQVTLIGTTFDTALANININQGTLGINGTTTLGDPTKTIPAFSSAGILQIYPYANFTLNGAITNFGLTKLGGGMLTLSGGNTYTGATIVSSGTLTLSGGNTGTTIVSGGTLDVNGQNISNEPIVAQGTLVLNGTTALGDATYMVGAISGRGKPLLNPDANLTLTATSITQGTLTIGAGTTLTIAPIPGGPLLGSGSLKAVSGSPLVTDGTSSPIPEPGTLALLITACMFLTAAAWRKRLQNI